MKDIWQYPTSGVTQRYQRLNISNSIGNNFKNSFLRRCFIYSSSVVISQGRIKILSLTEKGKKVIGINAGESDRHGGPEHRYWVTRIADHLKIQGYQVTAEVAIGGGKAIDIVASRNDKQIALEIETGKSDVNANVIKSLSAGMNTIYIIATSNKARRMIESKLTGFNGIEVLLANQAIVKKNW